MLFDGIPEEKRHNFDSIAIEQTLPNKNASDGANDESIKSRGVCVLEDESFQSRMCERMLSSWKQNLFCDMCVFVRCSSTWQEFVDEFKDAKEFPVSYFDDGLALIKMHSLVATASPLLRTSLIAATARNTAKLHRMKSDEDLKLGKRARSDNSSIASTPSTTSQIRSKEVEGLPEGASLATPGRSQDTASERSGLISFSLSNEHIEGCAFIRVVSFLYTGRLQLCEVTVSETLRASRYLGISEAVSICVLYLMKKLQPCNALSICALGNLFKCGSLEELADEYLSDHFMEVTDDVEWGELASDAVKRLLSRDNLTCDSEASVVRALLKWATYERTSDTDADAEAEADPKSGEETSQQVANKSPDSSTGNTDMEEDADGETNDENQENLENEDNEGAEDAEDRLVAFSAILRDGSIRFAHLSDEEIETLTQEIRAAGEPLLKEWLAAVTGENRKRRRRRLNVAKTRKVDSKMLGENEEDDEHPDHEHEEEEEDEETEPSSHMPRMRRYRTSAGCQVEEKKCIVTLNGHVGYVYAVIESPKGELVSGSRDQSIRVWDFNATRPGETPPSKVLYGHTDRVFGLCWTSSGKLASCSFDQTIRIWDPVSWECEKVLEGHSAWVVALSTCQGQLVSGSADSTVRVWDEQTWTCSNVLSGHTDHVYGVAGVVVPDTGKHLLATGSQDTTVKLWDPSQNWKDIATMQGHKGPIRSVKQCGRFLASASADLTIRLWIIAGKNIGSPAGTLIGHSSVVETLASIPQPNDGQPVLASASRDKSIMIWNPRTKSCLKTLVGHRNWVKSLCVLHDGNIASASADGTVRVWDPT